MRSAAPINGSEARQVPKFSSSRRANMSAAPGRTRVAAVGAGLIAQSVHLPGLQRLSALFDLRLVCDLSPSRAREVAGRLGPDVRATSDPDAVLAADDVDAVLLATTGSHGPLASAALRAGKHVLSEKPLCLTVREAMELEAQAARSDRVLQVGYMKMYDPVVEEASKRLCELDQPRMVRVTVLHPADAPQVAHLRLIRHDDVDPEVMARHREQEEERTVEALGQVPSALGRFYRDVLCGSVVHELSVLRALGTKLPHRFEDVSVWPWPWEKEPPCLLAVGSLGPDAKLVLSWNWLPDHPEYSEEVAIFARNGRLRLSMAPPYLLEARSSLRLERAESDLRADTTFYTGRDGGFLRQLKDFAACIRSGAPPRSGAAGVAEDLACLQGVVAGLGRRLDIAVGGEAGGTGQSRS
jgi:predicted dehydrogenase